MADVIQRKRETGVHRFSGLCGVALSLLLVGCQGGKPGATSPQGQAPPTEKATEKTKEKPTEKYVPSGYSPFAVKVEGPYWADIISFKDVGLKATREADRDLWLEAVADGLAEAMEAPVTSEKVFDAELAKPEAHTHCEGRHIYVDVWRSSSPERLGFSLWKGCGAEDRFLWEEVPGATLGAQGLEGVDAAAKLGAHIGRALARCPEARCS